METRLPSILFVAALAAGAGAQPLSPYRPAVLNNLAELEYIKGRVEAGAAPWKAAYDKMRTSALAGLARAPEPRATVECGPYNEPNQGCTEESDDSKAAYTQALLWRLTGKAEHAAKAAAILDAWSAVLKSHTNHNAPLQASWTAPLFARAGVILKETYPAWPQAGRDRLAGMFASAFRPLIIEGNWHSNGNWELSYIEALLSIGVFNGDTAAFNKGVFLWRKRVPAYFYLKSDGPRPVKPWNSGTRFDNQAQFETHWYNPGVWLDGLAQETCRDFPHTQMGLAAMINAAEIAYHQGLDLYTGEAHRITTAMEFHAGLLLGNTAPAGLCGGTFNKGNTATWEIAYNHFHGRMGRDLPLTRRLIVERLRPTGTFTHGAWETLTHAELGRTGVSVLAPAAPPVRSSARLVPGAAGLAILRDGATHGLDGRRLPDGEGL